MNQYSPYVKTYKSQRVETASPEAIIIMLYDGAIKFLNTAKKAKAEQNIQEYHNNVLKAQRIIFELMAALDLNVGGEIAENLYKLYEYMHHQLVNADIKQEVHLLEEVLAHLKELRSTWQQAIENSKKEQNLSGSGSSDGSGERNSNVYSA